MKKCLFVLPLLLLTACDPAEKQARDAIAGAKGVLETAQAEYRGSCTDKPEQQICRVIRQGVAAENLVIDVMEEYCQSASFEAGGTCRPDKSVQPKLQAALKNLNQIMLDVKATVKP